MKSGCFRKIAMVVCRFLFFITICECIVLWLNRKYSESWTILFYDLHSGFTDKKEYLSQFILIFPIFLLLYFLYVICNKSGLSFEWHIRLGKKKHYSVWKGYTVILILTCVCFFGVTAMLCGKLYKERVSENYWKGSTLIGHSFGGIDEYHYTGSLEAFRKNYDAGRRVFEVDLDITSDDKAVLRHDWDQAIQEGISSENVPTEEKFLSIPIHGIYTPLSFKDLCLLMQEYPDIWIITDSKYADWESIKREFTIMIQTAEECNAIEVLDRLVIQIYNESMYEAVKEVYPFKSYIFTMYQRWDGTPEQFTQICRWCVENGVNAITMPYYHAKEENLEVARRYDRDIYVHTVNDLTEANDFLKKGIRGIYTDDIQLEELEEEKE